MNARWFRSPTLHPCTLALAVSAYIALAFNLPFYLALERIFQQLEHVDYGFVASIPLFVIAVLNLVLALCCWKGITKPLVIMLIISSSLVSYTMLTYGVVFDYGMIENLFETNPAEAGSYLNLNVVLWLTITALLPTLVVCRVRLCQRQTLAGELLHKAASVTLSVLCVLAIAFFYYKDYSSVGRNNSYLKTMIVPTHFIYSSAKYINNTFLTTPVPFETLGQDASQSPLAADDKPTLMVIVVGETARSMNLAYNGYSRPTTPFTQDKNLISMKRVSSCGTATAVSVPCLFSPQTRSGFDGKRARNQSNLMDIFGYAGIDSVWKDNDGGSKGVAKRMSYLPVDPSAHPQFCEGGVCVDEVLLEDFDTQIDAMQGNRVVVLHLIGSHGPTYYQRYPQSMAAFTPACNSNNIETCTEQELVNVYDNTIRYTDYVLNQTIKRLQGMSDRYKTALVYLSDHGESLGENGLYLHGFPYGLAPKQQTTVPWLMWFSDAFSRDKGIDRQCLVKKGEQAELSHDNFFHSMLGIMDVHTSLYQPQLDLFADCRQ
ncbi:phosphoethanolamine transferase [Ferrimonas kyonanensis]|uniref:phosphoethanolamine transferase n=1 Tax=Ferrimonas kyonanensis TaxID=364763 RepID=UPI0003FF7888|nr:phosphoethanolamine--lipid A transferase [Ferrimonas kyonanensis]